MKKLLIFILLFSVIGCGEIANEIADHARCNFDKGKALPIIQMYPQPNAIDVPPNSVIALEHQVEQTGSFNVIDTKDPEWKYATGSSISINSRLYIFVDGTQSGNMESTLELMDRAMHDPFESLRDIRTERAFSENSEIRVTAIVGCYDPYKFSFTTGTLQE